MNEREYVRKSERVTAVQWNKPGDHPDVKVLMGPGRNEGEYYVSIRGYMRNLPVGGWIVDDVRRPSPTIVPDQEFRRDYEPVDDAREGEALRLLRQLVDENPWVESYTGDVSCHHCHAGNHGDKAHEPGCPWVAAKRITEDAR